MNKAEFQFKFLVDDRSRGTTLKKLNLINPINFYFKGKNQLSK